MQKLQAGQSLWFVGAGNFKGKQGEVQITAVGRRWAIVKGAFTGAIDIKTLAANGKQYSSPGRCYLSQQEWLEQEGPKLAWMELRTRMPMNCPADLTLDAIVQAAKLLSVKLTVPVAGEG